jgi:aspartyl-tRNA(Asn)/glutamyl-tRNA(Gln) amidotransferase subunit A
VPEDVTSPSTELAFMTIAEMARRIAEKELSPVELTTALIRRAEALDPQLNAYLLPTPDRALDQARAAEREIASGRYLGPMHGIPFGLKDIYATSGIRTTGHSRTAIDTVPDFDATTVAKLSAAGAVLTGKLATHEFAHGGPSFDLPWPPARNPWNRDHFTGGSSSGSGAAVAAGLVPAALGSDTGGSIRGPAAFCGIVGLKPTYGLVSRYGVYANSFSFDHAGPMTWTVEDCAILLQAIAGHDPKDPASAAHPVPDYRAALTGDIKGLRIGVVRHLHEDDCPVTAETGAALEEALRVLRALGASLGEVRLRPSQDYYDVKVTIAESELLAVHEPVLRTRPGEFGEDFLGRVLPADVGRDGAGLRQFRRARHGDGGGSGAAARRVADHRVLAPAVVDDAIQRDRRPRFGAVHRLQQKRPAAVDAGGGPAVCRDDGAARGARLRAGDRMAHAPAAARSRRALFDRVASGPGP